MMADFVYYYLCQHFRPHVIAADDCLRRFRLTKMLTGLILLRFHSEYWASYHFHEQFRLFVSEDARHIFTYRLIIVKIYIFRVDYRLTLFKTVVLITAWARRGFARRLAPLAGVLFYSRRGLLHRRFLLNNRLLEPFVEKSRLVVKHIRLKAVLLAPVEHALEHHDAVLEG